MSLMPAFFVPFNSLIIRCGKELDLDLYRGESLRDATMTDAGRIIS